MIIDMNVEKFLKCINDKHRRQIIECLRTGEKSVNEIIKLTNLEQTLVSFHLRSLKNCGLVINKRVGKKLFYRISHSGVIEILDFIKERSSEIVDLTPGEECE